MSQAARGRAQRARPPCARRVGRPPVARSLPNSAAASSIVQTGPAETSSPSISSSHSASVAQRSPRRARPHRFLVGVELPLGELRPADDLAQPLPELRLERADGEPPPVGGRVQPVAGEPTGQQPLGQAAEPVRDEAGASRGSSRPQRGARGRSARGRAAPRPPRAPRRARRRRGRRPASAAAPAPCRRGRPPSPGS